MDAPIDPAPLDEVHEWLRQGDKLRERLLEEREQHVARIAEIDTALKQWPAKRQPDGLRGYPSLFDERGAPQLGTVVRPLDPAAKVPAVVRWILETHPGGLTGAEIVAEALRVRPKIDVRNIYSALQRAKWLRAEGKPRKQRYFLAPDQAGGEE